MNTQFRPPEISKKFKDRLLNAAIIITALIPLLVSTILCNDVPVLAETATAATGDNRTGDLQEQDLTYRICSVLNTVSGGNWFELQVRSSLAAETPKRLPLLAAELPRENPWRSPIE